VVCGGVQVDVTYPVIRLMQCKPPERFDPGDTQSSPADGRTVMRIG
jgi:hypothetical protein